MRDNACQFAFSIFAGNLLAALVKSGALSRADACALADEVANETANTVKDERLHRYFSEAAAIFKEGRETALDINEGC